MKPPEESPLRRLLIVDDDAAVLDILQRLLSGDGTEIALAEGGVQALQLARSAPFDVALLDKNLIGENGLDLGRELRKLQPELELIVVTGYASVESAIEAVQLGVFDYVTKPIEDMAGLVTKVRHAAEKSALRRSQRQLLQRLAEERQRYHRLVDSSPDAVLVIDAATGAITEANPAAQRLYGFSAGELHGQPFSTLALGEGLHRRRDGSEFPVEASSSEFEAGGTRLRVVSVRDVSERERAAKKQRELEERLRLSQKMEAIGRLAGGVAHDFNNLLAVLKAHAEFLKEGLVEGDPAHEDVDGILQATGRGAALIRQLLVFSRRKQPDDTTTDLNEAVLDAHKLLARVLGEQVPIELQLARPSCQVRASLDQLSQVLINLALNARDAMPGGGRIVVCTERLDAEASRSTSHGLLPAGRYVRLSVSDTGLGMTQEVQQRIFEPFFTTKPEGKGTGLGLATVWAIVEAAGGTVSVESAPGAGTTFHVFLPVPAKADARDAARPAEVPERGRGETVLLVEDEDTLRAVVKRMLTTGGYQVLEASNGAAALRLARTAGTRIDLVVSDIVMPQMSGRELARQLSAERPALPVLFMTGYSEEAAVDLQAGSPRVIQKPFGGAALLSKVRRLLDQPGTSQ
jgi:two-component system, cell cycle sensor histidine kinase and response regulator CckA